MSVYDMGKFLKIFYIFFEIQEFLNGNVLEIAKCMLEKNRLKIQNWLNTARWISCSGR